ncbi:MAG: hypothetical protein QME35_08305 [Thermoanaerobacteraceae bacterium]|nr:hypothetical protein [Thermoanaerobacteraceae bacterium]
MSIIVLILYLCSFTTSTIRLWARKASYGNPDFMTKIRDGEELQNKIEYIHNNPVRAGIVETPEEYEFSSYNYYYDKVNNYFIGMLFNKQH